MDSTITLPQTSRVNSRHRRAQNIRLNRKQEEEGEGETKKEEDPVYGAWAQPSLAQKQKEKPQITMTKDHRFYHRRQAEAATKVLTVNIEVVATVDTSGNLIGQETKTQADPAEPTLGAAVDSSPGPVPSAAAPAASAVINALNAVEPSAPPALPIVPAVPVPLQPSLPQVPAVPAAPTVALPVVPSVPPFPSDLKVPPYPWSSGVPVLVAQASTGPVTPSPAPTSVLGSSATPVSISAALNPALNSTIISSSSLFSSTFLPSKSSALVSLSASNSVSVAASSRLSSSDSDEIASSRFGSATGSPSAGATTYYGGAGVGAGGPANTAAAPAQTSAATGASATGSTTPLQTPQVVGSVVGSLAGAALILAIILLLLQRHKRRRGALQLTNDETTDRSPPMTQDLSRNNRIPSAFLHRFSGMSRSTAETSTSVGERSFQRVSGRKLPSAFSEGMTSEQFSRGGTLSGSSFYQDDQGTYGGPGFSKELGKEIGSTPKAAGAGTMNIRPGPARTPVIRHPDDDVNPFDDPAPFPKADSHLSPPQSPNPDAPRSTLGRSLQSADGSRSSKFTENV
jgi:hypothetical protein